MNELLKKIKNHENPQLLIHGSGTPIALPSHVTVVGPGLSGGTNVGRNLMGGSMAAGNEVDDLMYNWINILKCKADGVYAYKRYLEDAKKEQSKCCEDLLNSLIEVDSKQILEVKRHVLGLLETDSKTRGYTAA